MHCAFSRGEIRLAVSKWLVILHKCRKKSVSLQIYFKYISCYFYRFFCNLPPGSIIFRCMERTRYVIRLLLM